MEDHPRGRGGSAADELTAALRDLRSERGLPSFNELVLRITEVRVARGVPREAARPGRTTVYDAFRPGRRRIDPRLVGDIVRALGEDQETAQTWERRCREVRARVERSAAPTAPTEPAPGPGAVLEPAGPEMVEEPAGPEAVLEPEEAARHRTIADPVGDDEAGTITGPASDDEAETSRPGWRSLLLIALLGIAVNMVGRLLVTDFQLALHLDMVGTALAAFAAGPWTAVCVAAATAGLGTAVDGSLSLAFLPVGTAGALVWGYGFHRFGLGQTPGRLFLLGTLTAGVCTMVAVPILLTLGGTIGRAGEQTVEVVRAMTNHLSTAVFASNLLYSLTDKVLSAFCAMALLDLVRGRRAGAEEQDVRDRERLDRDLLDRDLLDRDVSGPEVGQRRSASA